jgi:hypothetical protein
LSGRFARFVGVHMKRNASRHKCIVHVRIDRKPLVRHLVMRCELPGFQKFRQRHPQHSVVCSQSVFYLAASQPDECQELVEVIGSVLRELNKSLEYVFSMFVQRNLICKEPGKRLAFDMFQIEKRTSCKGRHGPSGISCLE